jgi:hypothetical protein
MHAAGMAHRDCHSKNVLVTSLTGATATAVVADLSRACRLPRLGARLLDVLAVVHMLLTLVVGVPFHEVDRVCSEARRLATAAGRSRLEESAVYVWPLLRTLLLEFLRKQPNSHWEPARLRAGLAAANVITMGHGELSELRRIIHPESTVIASSSIVQKLVDHEYIHSSSRSFSADASASASLTGSARAQCILRQAGSKRAAPADTPAAVPRKSSKP